MWAWAGVDDMVVDMDKDVEIVHPSGLRLGAAVDLGTDDLDAGVSTDDIDTDVGEADTHMVSVVSVTSTALAAVIIHTHVRLAQELSRSSGFGDIDNAMSSGLFKMHLLEWPAPQVHVQETAPRRTVWRC
ncbi:Tbc1 Domain Family Member 28 [Manis pentadactyla]|nr:Tbc1 Domain Family Member 28 [Manis pentadactyla]